MRSSSVKSETPQIIDKQSIYQIKISRCETLKKVLFVAALVFSISATTSFSVFALGNFAGIFIVNISSDILLGSSALLMGLSTISLFTKKIVSKYQNRIPLPKQVPNTTDEKIEETPVENIAAFDMSDEKITPNMFISTLNKYLEKFKPIDTNKYIGKIEKIDLEDNSKLILKADIHGDFVSLKKHLKTLQNKGYLDSNFKVKAEYKDKIVIAFLGDYIDRGENSFKVLNLVMKFKMNNPNEVVLLKGNHEDIATSKHFIDPSERHFYNNSELTNKLEKAYSTLILSTLIGTKDENNNYQYTCLSHGSIEPDIDLNEVLNSLEKRAEMLIKVNKEATLSNRILNILPPHLRDNEISQLQNTKGVLEQYLNSQNRTTERRVKRLLNIENINKKTAKQILATLKVQGFLKNYSNLIEGYRKNNNSNINWGDISKDRLGHNHYRSTALFLTPEFIKDYFETVSSDNRKIKALRVGHVHKHLKFESEYTKGFIETLPVAGELRCYDPLRKPIDYAQIIDIKPKVKEWKKSSLKRKRDEELATIGPEKTFYKSNKPPSAVTDILSDFEWLPRS